MDSGCLCYGERESLRSGRSCPTAVGRTTATAPGFVSFLSQSLSHKHTHTLPSYVLLLLLLQTKSLLLITALMSSAVAAFVPVSHKPMAFVVQAQKADWNQAAELGWSMGGEDYTREVKPQVNEDARKTIHEGPSFEEYMKQRAAGGN
jgi:hypothetical protein